jgi:hypothetical protein
MRYSLGFTAASHILSQTQYIIANVFVKHNSTLNKLFFRKIKDRYSLYRSYTDHHNAKVFIPRLVSLIVSKRERHTGYKLIR